MATVIILIILGISISFAIRQIVQNKKNGKSMQCGGDCRKCRGGCH